MTIRTDGDVIKVCRKIEKMQRQITALIMDIESSDHPNAAKIAEDLWEQCWFGAAAPVVASHGLLKSDAWEFEDRGATARHKAATKANASRRLTKKQKLENLTRRLAKRVSQLDVYP